MKTSRTAIDLAIIVILAFVLSYVLTMFSRTTNAGSLRHPNGTSPLTSHGQYPSSILSDNISSPWTCDSNAIEACALEIQANIASYNFWMAASATVGVVLIFATLFYTRKTALSAREGAAAAWSAVNATREVGQAQTQAYIWLTGGFVEVNNFIIYYRYELKNYGHSPARGVTLNIKSKLHGIIGKKPKSIELNTETYRVGNMDTSTPLTTPGLKHFGAIEGQNAKYDYTEYSYLDQIVSIMWTDVFGKEHREDFSCSAFLIPPQSGYIKTNNGAELKVNKGEIRPYADTRPDTRNPSKDV